MRRTLTAKSSFESLRKEAKRWLQAVRVQNHEGLTAAENADKLGLDAVADLLSP